MYAKIFNNDLSTRVRHGWRCSMNNPTKLERTTDSASVRDANDPLLHESVWQPLLLLYRGQSSRAIGKIEKEKCSN